MWYTHLAEEDRVEAYKKEFQDKQAVVERIRNMYCGLIFCINHPKGQEYWKWSIDNDRAEINNLVKFYKEI
jgi:hypothetical protein